MSDKYIIWETKYGPYIGGYGKSKETFDDELEAYKYLVKHYNVHDNNNDTDYEVVLYYEPTDHMNLKYRVADLIHRKTCTLHHPIECSYKEKDWKQFVNEQFKNSVRQEMYNRACELIEEIPNLKYLGYERIIEIIVGDS